MQNIDNKLKGGVVCTIEARMGSSRLPGKSLKLLQGRPMLEWVVQRASMADCVDRVIIATTNQSRDDAIEKFSEELGVYCYRGSEDDVLSRLVGVIEQYQPDLLVCLTGDNPFIDPALINDVVGFFQEKKLDFTSTVHMFHSEHWKENRSFPAGISVQVVQPSILVELDKECDDRNYREHSTKGIYDRADGKYIIKGFHCKGRYNSWNHPELRLTVDTIQDFRIAEQLISAVGGRLDFCTGDAIQFLAENHKILESSVER